MSKNIPDVAVMIQGDALAVVFIEVETSVPGVVAAAPHTVCTLKCLRSSH